MIINDKIKMLLKKKMTLKKASYDTINDEYMTSSDVEVYHLDGLLYAMQRYANQHDEIFVHRSSETPSACDALYIDKVNNKFVLIEFKNGKLPKKTIVNIHNKALDSIKILSYIFDMPLEVISKRTKFVLVYNEIKNTEPFECYEPYERELDYLTNGYIHFGLGKYQGTLYSEVHTLGIEQFNNNLERILK